MQVDALQRIESLLVTLTEQHTALHERQGALEQQQTAMQARQAAIESKLDALSSASSAAGSSGSIVNCSKATQATASSQDCSEPVTKRHTVDEIDLPLLERDDLLLSILGRVGTTDWLYVASVSHRWRGLYYSVCPKKQGDDEQNVTRTSWAAAVTTAERLKLAFASGLDVEDMNDSLYTFTEAVGELSLEPIPVMTLARVMGVEWYSGLCGTAAWKGDWAFLRWLCESDCPWVLQDVYNNAMTCGIAKRTMSILPWIKQQPGGPLPEDVLRQLMFEVGGDCDSSFVMWLRTELQAPWPDAFVGQSAYDEVCACWSTAAVRYALEQGSGWGAWRCQDLDPTLFADDDQKQKAEALFKWAHTEAAGLGFECPCTCEQAA